VEYARRDCEVGKASLVKQRACKRGLGGGKKAMSERRVISIEIFLRVKTTTMEVGLLM
jgi:hypothetical protein